MDPIASVAPLELARMLEDGNELAILDVREEWVFAHGHLLFAASAPLSRLEIRAPKLVPRRTTRIVLCDDAEGQAMQAADLLARHGYRAIHILEGGWRRWTELGHRAFKGIYVPSKAFGEMVEHAYRTPSITPEDLHALIARGSDIVILDSRPPQEFQRMSIPGAINCPGGELVYRIEAAVQSPATTVVVNCAGRTRSILGAQSLISAGIENPVFALRNGTMGWQLAGMDVARNIEALIGAPSEAAQLRAEARARRVAQRLRVKSIGPAEFESWRTDPNRTTYLFDVRTPDEYRSGHLPGARLAPGGQLVQAPDSYAATLRARCVLYDTDGVRATMTASWLVQLGTLDVYVLALGVDTPLPETGDETDESLGAAESGGVTAISADELAEWCAAGTVDVLDLATSNEFADEHIPGAWFVMRAHLREHLRRLVPDRHVVLTSTDGVVARIAALEARSFHAGEMRVLVGGTRGWRAAGHGTANGFDHALDEPVDVWHTPSSIFGRGKPEMQEYLDWETGLREQAAQEPGARFALAARDP